MQIVIDIPEGLKKDFELEQWTALSCMEMKDALLNGTPLTKGQGRLIDADGLRSMYSINRANFNTVVGIQKWIDDATTIIEADKTGKRG